jgi:hypothetical protein
MNGTGHYNTENDRFVLDIKTTGRWACDVEYVRQGDRVAVHGQCNGKPVQVDHNDIDRDKHKMPDLEAPKQD